MFKTVMLAAAIAGLTLGAPPGAPQALAQKADVMHWWTSGGESRAVKVFADEYNKTGGTWVDDPAIGPQAEHAAALNRIAGGDPPTGLMWNAGVAVQQLAQQGVLRPLDDLAKQDKLVANLPPLLAKSITYDGHVIAVPVDIGGGNYMYYSLKIFHDLNMEPPKTWDEFLAMAPKIKAAGTIPLAFGANAQQEDWLFSALVAGVGSADLYRKVFVDHDPKAAFSPEMQHVLSVMGQLRQYVDAGSPNRKWNDTLALVETNKAAMMIVGDWASADFTAAHLTFDKDYSCQMAPGNQNAYVMTEDVFVFPKTDKPEQIKAGDKLAKVMMDPAVQTAFNRIKGSLPARQDASTEGLDPCAQIGAKIIAGGPANQLPNFALAFSPDTEGQIEDLLGSYWATPSMTPADAAKRLSTILAGAS